MRFMKTLALLLLTQTANLFAAALTSDVTTTAPFSFMRGINFCGYWNNDYEHDYSSRSIAKIAETGNNWVSILVTWYQEDEKSTAIYMDSDKTPSDKSVRKAISDAKNLGLRVSLKPHIDLGNGKWRADIGAPQYVSDANFDAFFAAWFASYKSFMNHYAEMAEESGTEMLVIGTELINTTERQNGKTLPAWVAYIGELRQKYSGKLTYAADWSEWRDVSAPQTKIFWKDFWQALDYIGIDADYPLSKKENATISELVLGWQQPLSVLEQMSAAFQKPVVFTEFGFRSVEKCYISPGDYKLNFPASEECQRNSYIATYQALTGRKWLSGIFWWSWMPYLKSDITNPENPWWVTQKYQGYLRDYTPEGKSAESILKNENLTAGKKWASY